MFPCPVFAMSIISDSNHFSTSRVEGTGQRSRLTIQSSWGSDPDRCPAFTRKPDEDKRKGKVDERMECTLMDIYQNRLPQCDQIILILFLIFTVGEVACGPSPEAIPVHNVVPSARTIALLIRKPCARAALTSLPGMEKKNHAKSHPPCFPARIRVIYKIHRSI